MAIAQNLEGKRWKAVEGGRHHPKRRAGAAVRFGAVQLRHIAPLGSRSPHPTGRREVLGIWSVKYIPGHRRAGRRGPEPRIVHRERLPSSRGDRGRAPAFSMHRGAPSARRAWVSSTN